MLRIFFFQQLLLIICKHFIDPFYVREKYSSPFLYFTVSCGLVVKNTKRTHSYLFLCYYLSYADGLLKEALVEIWHQNRHATFCCFGCFLSGSVKKIKYIIINIWKGRRRVEAKKRGVKQESSIRGRKRGTVSFVLVLKPPLHRFYSWVWHKINHVDPLPGGSQADEFTAEFLSLYTPDYTHLSIFFQCPVCMYSKRVLEPIVALTQLKWGTPCSSQQSVAVATWRN